MVSCVEIDFCDLVQAVQSGPELQRVVANLPEYFSLNSIPEKDGCSQVKCSHDVSSALQEVREQLKHEYIAKKVILSFPVVRDFY